MLAFTTIIIVVHLVFKSNYAISSTNALNEWWRPTDIGSVALLDTSSYIDPYRADTSQFRPYVSGYTTNTPPVSHINTNSFEQCMEQCVKDINCKAFEINMLILPFRCKLSVKPCPDGSCSEFISHPEWKHFVRDDFNTNISQSIISLTTLDGKYRPRQTHKINGYSVTANLGGNVFDYVEIEVSDASPDSTLIDYVWFEYKLQSNSPWLKCQRVQLPQIATIYHVPNMCLQFKFDTNVVEQKCDVLKESWEYHPITTQTTKIGTVHLDDQQPGISLQTCSDNLVQNNAKGMAKIYYEKLDAVHQIRLFSTVGKFAVDRLDPKLLQQTVPNPSPPIVTRAGDDGFKHPHNSTTKSNDSRNKIADWYYDILNDGGHLWCRNPLNSAEPVAATNVFQRMHHTCYYRGSTLSKTSNDAMSGKERIHYFNAEQCSFDANNIPNCGKSWVEIQENCQGWEYCESVLNQASNVEIYHHGTHSNGTFNGKQVEFPIVSWKSGWNRADSIDSELMWSIDYTTDILLVLHDCLTEFDDFSGCSNCMSPYYEAEYNPNITVQNLRIYKYDISAQYCRPQSTVWENKCKQGSFCPKGENTGFEAHQYWTCRTNFNWKQDVITAVSNTKEDINQGFGCFKK